MTEIEKLLNSVIKTQADIELEKNPQVQYIPATWSISLTRDSLNSDILNEFNYKGFILKEHNNSLYLCKPEFDLEGYLQG